MLTTPIGGDRPPLFNRSGRRLEPYGLEMIEDSPSTKVPVIIEIPSHHREDDQTDDNEKDVSKY
jgi:hypothetical protein